MSENEEFESLRGEGWSGKGREKREI